MLALGITGWFVIPLIYQLNHSLYNRLGLASVTEEKFGTTRISEVISEDIMIVAYDFRNHKPVIFTKYAATNKDTSAKMNVLIRDAAQASSAAPIYFDPKPIEGISDALIDGGVIANSPAFYSYIHAKYVRQQKKKIRLVSIGTGEQQPQALSTDNVNKVTWVNELGALITTVEQNTHDYLNNEILQQDYLRFQAKMNKTLSLDSYQSDDIKELIRYGEAIVSEYKERIDNLCVALVDQNIKKICPKCTKVTPILILKETHIDL
ncbi:hypothetical protein FGO68_gene11325 [Halteria grandinella]|uniref:PNPLA domain-containing protein n=1 Tax=Halteria grandinella TaxID=5974 RepID=A0A8J8NES4_HALGN|nr:hypothetical protein FGO68_gene11325 [Halteria grandinella]